MNFLGDVYWPAHGQTEDTGSGEGSGRHDERKDVGTCHVEQNSYRER